MTGSGVSLRSFRDLPILLQCLNCKAAAFGVFRFLWVIFRSKRLEYKRMLVGLLIHLVVCGYVLPTIQTMHSLLERNRVDVSIARYFVTELLHVAAPPYDPLFLSAIHPLVSHPHIFDGLRTDRNTDIVNEFLGMSFAN
ncbi:unnamed protein product [Dibothriocephalus latus]|uniref:Uncharacterized protein n=1 Tax=Dibothriocephalus latus TaxID=60516 RepID=A0A3P7MCU2_DIBLA|nr:unnamed protein product [Dibothriocephalus latus]